MNSPCLSVVMPTNNSLPFLNESIRSILNQTFKDFEFVILDDASTVGSDCVLREWEARDNRIRLFKSDRKLGLPVSSNFVVRNSRAPIVARMDADDICFPDRLKRQWEILQTQPEVVAIGTLCEGIDASGQPVRPRDRWRLVRRSPYVPFPHGSAIIRRTAFEAINGYSEEFFSGEDQDFFFKLTTVGRVVTLPDMLYQYRYHSSNTTFSTAYSSVSAVTNRYGQNGRRIGRFSFAWGDAPLGRPGARNSSANDGEETFQTLLADDDGIWLPRLWEL